MAAATIKAAKPATLTTASLTTATLAEIYTDGSCHTQHRVGAWVAILLIGPVGPTGPEKKVLSGVVPDTTHNRMELAAVIRALEWIRVHIPSLPTIKICSDSQYVIGLPARVTQKGIPAQNGDLVKALLDQCSAFTIEWIKIKAHRKNTGAPDYNTAPDYNYNREADQLARKMVRERIRLLIPPSSSSPG